jgi:hypothetical protein
MPHFFFHIDSPEEKFPDDMGADLPDAAAAHQRALRLIDRVMLYRELEIGTPPEQWSRWVLHVADANGHNILSVLFPRARTDVRRTSLSVTRRANARFTKPTGAPSRAP